MQFLKQATASQSRALGPFLNATDFKTAETALTIANTDIKLMANGGVSANKTAGGGTHRVNGFYGVTFDATDTATVGQLKVSVSVAGALPVFETFTVVEEAIYDAQYAADSNAFAVSAFGTLSGTHSATTCDLGTTAPANDISGQQIYFVGHKLTRVIDSYATGTGVATFSPAVAVTLTNADAYVVIASAPASTSAYPLVQLAAITHTSAVVPTVTALTGNTAQTGDSFARIGATGSGLTTLATQASVNTIDDFLDTEIAAILAAVDTEIATLVSELAKVPKSDSNVSLNATALAAIADGLLDRNMATGTDSGSTTVRTPRQALRALRNKWSIAASTLTVTKEDDVTASHTAAVTGTTGADPITAVDPAGP